MCSSAKHKSQDMDQEIDNLPLEHVRVFKVSTMPSVGFIARFAMPVLKFIDVMSRMAVPVVSEPVPAVVGTAINGLSFCSIGRPLPTGALMKSKRSASL
jgi:hypothetical protein